MASYQIQYWHDIPVLVRAKVGRERISAQLPSRFMEAVDSAAMSAGLIGTDEYLSGFRWGEAIEQAGTAQEVADAVAASLDQQHPTIDWQATAKAIKAAAS